MTFAAASLPAPAAPPASAGSPGADRPAPHFAARVVAWLAYGIALALLLGAVLPLPPAGHLAYQPTPDAPEYLCGAIALARDGTTSIPVAGERLPSRYPPGYAAAAAAWIVCGVDPLRAPFAASAFAALLLLAMVAVAAWRLAGPLASALAVLGLAAAPGFLALARAPMATTTSVALTTAGTLLLAAWAHGVHATNGRRARAGIAGVAGSVLLGLAAVVWLANVLLWPVAAAAWLVARRSRRAGMPQAAAIAGGLLAGSAPLLWHQWRTFGDPLANGYRYWVPGADTVASTFGLSNVAGNAAYLAREALQLEWRATAAAFHGSIDHLGPAGFVLGAWACVHALRDRRCRWLLAALVPFAAAMTAYAFRDARFFAPLVPFAAIAAAAALVAALPHAGRMRRAAIGALLALHLAAVPGSRGEPSSLVPLLRTPPPSPQHAVLARLAASPAGAALVTCNPVYAAAVLGEDWTAAPANDDHDYRWNPARFVFGAAERGAFVQRMLAADRPVYLLVPADTPGGAVDDSALAALTRRRWRPLWTADGFVAMQLTPQ